ncbi:MAG: lysylphosphatidylglycerol synthase transmembrane domain-containing protein [Acidobacteriaceae bacterium]
MEATTHTSNRLVSLVILAITILGVVVVASDWQDMRQVLVESDWRFIPAIMLFTFLSYLCYSYGYAYVCELLEIKLGKRELAEICFISTVVNHVLTTAGIAGYSLRYLLMKMYNISFKDVLSSSFIHYYLTSLDMLSFLPLTFIYLLLNAAVPKGIAIALGLMTLLFGLVLILTTGIVLFPSRRYPIIQLLGRIGVKILHRDYLPWLTQLDETLTRGTLAIRQRPLLLGWIMFLTLVDFICSITAMGFVFEALGPAVSAPALVTGYVIGIMAGLLSMVPGGFGVQEGSMAGIYALLNIRLEQALLAAILFRILYYLVPYFLILPFYRRLLHRAKQTVTSDS